MIIYIIDYSDNPATKNNILIEILNKRKEELKKILNKKEGEEKRKLFEKASEDLSNIKNVKSADYDELTSKLKQNY